MFFIGNDGLSSKQVGSQASLSAAGLDPTCLHKHKCGSRTERVKNCDIKFCISSYSNWFNLELADVCFTKTIILATLLSALKSGIFTERLWLVFNTHFVYISGGVCIHSVPRRERSIPEIPRHVLYEIRKISIDLPFYPTTIQQKLATTVVKSSHTKRNNLDRYSF